MGYDKFRVITASNSVGKMTAITHLDVIGVRKEGRGSKYVEDMEGGNNENIKHEMEEKDKKYVAAIDIGTAFSGCAYTDIKRHKREPLGVTFIKPPGRRKTADKQPTTILFDKEENFHSFGYLAEEQYSTSLQDKTNVESDWFYFKNFKMCLYENKNVSRDMKLRDKGGKEMKAMTVFSAGIKCLKKNVLDSIVKTYGHVDEADITFIITVPAIWNEPAKQFMKEAAIQAGIPSDQLMLVLEPEAAAVYCKTLWKNSMLGDNDSVIQKCMEPGGRNFVLDLGGGTIDTTVHEVKEDGNLIEVYKASGGPWGGCKVNDNFVDYIKNTYGADALTKMRQERPLDCYKLEKEFEDTKRDLTLDEHESVSLRVPGRLKQYSDNLVTNHTVDHLYVEKKDFMNFFDTCIAEIIKHIKHIRQQVGDIELILLVGGFAESPYLQEKIKSANQGIKVVVPEDSSLAVLKGAVMFGYNPSCITARRSRYTYGVEIGRPFDHKIHPKEKLFIRGGQEYCNDIFDVLVTKNTIVGVDEERTTSTTNTLGDKDDKFCIFTMPLYASVESEPKYTTDKGCTYLGKIVKKPPENGWGEISKFTTRCYFGRTQVTMKVIDEMNKKEYDSIFDLLE